MLAILLVTFPFFALVLSGYVAARRLWLPQAAIPGLNTFVLYFALPCMLYRFGSSTPIAQLLDGRRNVGCKLTTAVYFSPISCQISRYSAAKSSKTILAGANFRSDAFCRPGS